MEKDVIKYHTCLLMAIGLLAAASSMAQVGSNKLKKQVTVFRNEIRVDSFLNLLARQTGIGFSFNSKKISPAKVIPLKKGAYSVEECLLKIQQTSGIHYALISNNIILVDNPPQEKYRLQLSQKKTVTTAIVKSSTSTTVKKSTPPKPVAPKSTGTSQPASTRNGTVSESLSTRTELAGRSAQTIQKAMADTTTIQTKKSVLPDSIPLTTRRLTTETIKKMRPSRSAMARAANAQAAQSTASAGRSRRDRGDNDKDWNLIAGASLLRPDFSGMNIGLSVLGQYEKKFSNKWSWTGSIGYNHTMGKYIGDSVQVDTATFRAGDTVKNFGHIPALLGLRYYVYKPVYLSFEIGYSISTNSSVAASCLTFCPAVGMQLPVGNGAIDVNVNYLWLKEKMTYPEAPYFTSGGLGFWSLRVGWVF